MTIVNAMKQTASQAAAPDNLMGWGILNALAARNSLNGPDTSGLPSVEFGYTLRQNFPNPFNPGTHISYLIPVESDVTIAVYDIIGREVTTLVQGRLQRGNYQAEWDGKDRRGVPVAAGVYIYRLVAAGVDGNQSVISNKMLLVR
jgi:hypothetical protein